MNNFVYSNPTRVYFGKGQITRLDEALPQFSTVMLLYGGGSIKQNGVYQQVRDHLGKRKVVEFGGIEPNPTYETLMKAVTYGRSENAGFLLSVGGGSVLDGTKFIAAALVFDGDPWDFVKMSSLIHSAIPFGAVLTLPATGSEMNASSVISRISTREKLAFNSPHVYPRFSILDPETTYSLPTRQIANGLADTFVHVMEQYLTYPVQAHLQDRMAEGIIRTLIEIGPKTLEYPNDYDTRASLMWAAAMALNGLIACGVPQDWSTHIIGHELTALYGIDHARTLTMVLPSLMRVQQESKKAKILQYGERIWGITDGSKEDRFETTVRKTESFFLQLGLPIRLSAYKEISPDTPSIVAERLAQRGALPIGEHRDIDAVRVRMILEHSLTGVLALPEPIVL